MTQQFGFYLDLLEVEGVCFRGGICCLVRVKEQIPKFHSEGFRYPFVAASQPRYLLHQSASHTY